MCNDNLIKKCTQLSNIFFNILNETKLLGNLLVHFADTLGPESF